MPKMPQPNGTKTVPYSELRERRKEAIRLAFKDYPNVLGHYAGEAKFFHAGKLITGKITHTTLMVSFTHMTVGLFIARMLATRAHNEVNPTATHHFHNCMERVNKKVAVIFRELFEDPAYTVEASYDKTKAVVHYENYYGSLCLSALSREKVLDPTTDEVHWWEDFFIGLKQAVPGAEDFIDKLDMTAEIEFTFRNIETGIQLQ